MNLCTWNIRGLNDPLKIKELQQFLRKNHVNVIGVLENKVKLKNEVTIQKKFGNHWRLQFNSCKSPKRRIRVRWCVDDVIMDIRRVEEQFIHCQI